MSGKDKTDVETPEKRRHTEKEQIVELDGEYGYYKNDSFHSLSNFILKCEGVVEEDGVITGYMMRAKPKDNRDENVENWVFVYIPTISCTQKTDVHFRYEISKTYCRL